MLKFLRYFLLVGGLTVLMLGGVLSIMRGRGPSTAVWIVYSGFGPGSNLDLYQMRGDGSQHESVIGYPFDEYHPVWSPDGKSIVYTADPATIRDLVRLDLRRGTQAVILSNASFSSWSPDGQWIVLRSQRNDTLSFELYRVPSDGRQPPLRLTNHAANETAPSYSPDGQWIVFSADNPDGLDNVEQRNQDIYRITARGGIRDRLTTDPAIDRLPSYSPDGQWIVFLSDRDDGSRVYRIPADGSGLPERLSDISSVDSRPVYSPDGQWVAFTGRVDGNFDVYRIPAVGGDAQRLTDSPEYEGFPSYSPLYDLPVQMGRVWLIGVVLLAAGIGLSLIPFRLN